MKNPSPKTAIVVGATGLIGGYLTKKLLGDTRYKLVKVFVRRSTGIINPKLEEYIVDFDQINKWKDKITGDELFSAMGTTIKQAGSKKEQYKVDFTYQYEIAKAASENGVEKHILVSSAGANHQSKNFYLRIKGELEKKVAKLPFSKIVIFQPSILAGERPENRLGEKLGICIANIVTRIIPTLRKYRPIRGGTVADAMINSADDSNLEKVIEYRLDQIFIIAQ